MFLAPAFARSSLLNIVTHCFPITLPLTTNTLGFARASKKKCSRNFGSEGPRIKASRILSEKSCASVLKDLISKMTLRPVFVQASGGHAFRAGIELHALGTNRAM